jgi:hypothetical protein
VLSFPLPQVHLMAYSHGKNVQQGSPIVIYLPTTCKMGLNQVEERSCTKVLKEPNIKVFGSGGDGCRQSDGFFLFFQFRSSYLFVWSSPYSGLHTLLNGAHVSCRECPAGRPAPLERPMYIASKACKIHVQSYKTAGVSRPRC